MAKRARGKVNKAARTALRTDKPKSVEDFFDATGALKNPKHEAFAHKWVQTFDQEEALAAGGYQKPKNANSKYCQARSILRRKDVMIRVRSILKERVKSFAVTENFIIFKMLDVYDKAMEEKPILAKNAESGEMEVVGKEYQDLRVAMQTLKELGTNIGMFIKKSDERAASVVINMNYGDDQKALPVPSIQGESKRLN